MKKVLIIVANKYEDVELVGTVDILGRNDYGYDMVSVESSEYTTGKYGSMFPTTLIDLNKIDVSKYCALFLPGGPGFPAVLDSQDAITIIQKFNEAQKTIGAICAGPSALVKAGITKGKKITLHPSYTQNIETTGNEVEIDGKIVTGRDMKATLKFAEALVEVMPQCKRDLETNSCKCEQ